MPTGALTTEPDPRPDRRMPYSGWYPFAGGIAIGLAMRLLFNGKPGEFWSPMLASFMVLVPVLVGMVTVYIAERIKPRSWLYWLGAPAVAISLVVLGTFLILIEGLICAVIALPLFMAAAGAGGLIMGAVYRWTRRSTQTLASFAMLPLALGAFEHRLPNPVRLASIDRSMVIAAPAETIWREIHDTRAIRPEEVKHGWIYRIGVPLPVSGTTEQTPAGPVRMVRMGKDIHFEQVPVELVPNRHVLWKYRFAEDSFPPRALDDHVRIGGDYFDLRTTSYTLEPVAGGTRVTLRMEYRVSTRFNWYADPVAQLLIGNVEDVLLGFYKARSEAAS